MFIRNPQLGFLPSHTRNPNTNETESTEQLLLTQEGGSLLLFLAPHNHSNTLQSLKVMNPSFLA